MTWQECFEICNYSSLIGKEYDGRKLLIEEFWENDNIPSELRQVYISKQKDEMFLILQPVPNTDIVAFCGQWDARIMSFINFGSLPTEQNRKEGHLAINILRYNITQIILHSSTEENLKAGEKPLMQRPSNFSEEKSVSVSRKIFLGIESDDDIPKDNELLLPFWFGELEEAKISPLQEESLKALLPTNIECLLKKHVKLDRREKNIANDQKYFADNEIELVKGWLSDDNA